MFWFPSGSFCGRMTKEIDEAGKRAARKMKILLQHKTLELLLHDMVAVQGLKETRDILVWWNERLNEF